MADDFTVDVPITCRAKSSGAENLRWVRAVEGENTLSFSANNQVCTLPRPDKFLYVE